MDNEKIEKSRIYCVLHLLYYNTNLKTNNSKTRILITIVMKKLLSTFYFFNYVHKNLKIHKNPQSIYQIITKVDINVIRFITVVIIILNILELFKDEFAGLPAQSQ